MDEAEQLETLKFYWKQYGKKALTLLAVVAVGIFGWTKWQEKQEQDKERASAYYETFLQSVEAQDKAAIEAQAKHILTNFPDSSYALFTRLTLAKQAVLAGNLEEAVSHLEKAATLAKNTPLKHLVKLRLARVLLAKKEPGKALTLLEEEKPDLYRSLYEEIKGDSYRALSKLEDARRAFRTALAEAPPGMPKNVILQMKLDNLGE